MSTMTRKMMVGFAGAAAIVAAASATGASAQTCGWFNSPVVLPGGQIVSGQGWDCRDRGPPRGSAKNAGTVEAPLQCDNWRYTWTRTTQGTRSARWCPG